MKETRRTAGLRPLAITVVLVACSAGAAPTYARRKAASLSPDDPTYQLFQRLNDSYGGKLTDFCLIADTYADPAHPGQRLQHVLQVDYGKDRFFGRFRIYVRGVSQLTPAQLKEYTPEQIYGFGSDVAKFEKINPGPLGQTGDLYFRVTAGGALAPAPITSEADQQYETLLTRYVLPALDKNVSVATARR